MLSNAFQVFYAQRKDNTVEVTLRKTQSNIVFLRTCVLDFFALIGFTKQTDNYVAERVINNTYWRFLTKYKL